MTEVIKQSIMLSMNQLENHVIYEQRVVHAQWEGTIPAASINEAIKYVWIPLVKEHRDIAILMVDYEKASLEQLSAQDVDQISKTSEQLLEVRPDIRIILVVQGELEFGLARMWEALTTVVPERTHLVRSLEEGLKIIETEIS